jgi:signal transduction histidine kinase/ABC-type uncharacterized transport system substrate-binding protein
VGKMRVLESVYAIVLTLFAQLTSIPLCFILLVGIADHIRSDDTDLPAKRVLILYTHRIALPITQQWDKGIRSSLQAELKRPVTIDVEYVDSDRLGGEEAIEKWFELLQLKYTATPPDLIIPVFDPTAIEFANHAQNFFPKSDVVFCSINKRTQANLKINNRTAGVTYQIDYRKTIELGKQILPRLKRVIVVCGSSQENLALLEDFKREIQGDVAYEMGAIEFEYWIGFPVEEMCDKARRAPADSAILYLVHDRDKNGRSFITPQEVVAQLAEASAVPVFGLYDNLIGSGVLGGVMAPVEAQGKKAGSIAAQILNGESPADFSFSGTGDNATLFDWRQLQRWEIDESQLPNDARILFRKQTLWEEYSYYFWVVMVALVFQSLLIGGLWANRKQRIRAESALASQLEFETFLSKVRSHFIHVSLEQLPREMESTLYEICRQLRLEFGAIYELTEKALSLRFSTSGKLKHEFASQATVDLSAVPDLWKRLSDGEVVFVKHNTGPEKTSCEEWLTPGNAGPCWLFPLTTQGKQFGIAFFVPSQRDGDPAEHDVQQLTTLTEVLANVLAREQSERELQVSRGNAKQLARKLLTAQEDERRRLAREMHDDITQRLAAAAIACGQIQKDAALSHESKADVSDLSESLIKISKDVHQFSRRLHPSILEELGLFDAIRHECNTLALQSKIVVTLRFNQMPDNLSKDLQLCLYRIVQESLRNMVKHSRATEGEITLNADAEWVHLEVKDNGCGIPAVRDRERLGLGLVAMEERVQLVGGLLAITSLKDAGTCIEVRLPLKPDEMESSASS